MRALLAALAVAGATLAGPPAALAATGGDFSLRPLRPPDAPARERFYVVRTVEPGGVTEDRVVVENLTAAPLELVVEAVDAVINADGAFAPLAPGRRAATGAWIDVPSAPVRLAPHGSATVPVTIRVPPDAAAGEYFGAVTVRRPFPRPAAGGVAVAERVAVRVYLTVVGRKGFPAPTFTIEQFRFAGTAARPAFVVEVANTGVLAVEPLGTLTLEGPRRARVSLPVLGTVPAGERRTLRFTVPGRLAPGRYRASLVLQPLSGGTSRAAATAFTIPGHREVAAEKESTASAPTPRRPGVAAAVAALLLAVVAASLAVARTRRAERR